MCAAVAENTMGRLSTCLSARSKKERLTTCAAGCVVILQSVVKCMSKLIYALQAQRLHNVESILLHACKHALTRPEF